MGSAHTPGSEVINVEVPGGALAVEVISSGAATFRDGLDALVTVQPVTGVDHPGSIMSPAGARACVALIEAALLVDVRS
jgi:hypothetical protein